MNTDMIIAELRSEVRKLEQAFPVLESVGDFRSRAGSRTKNSGARTTRRKLSAAGRSRIAAAQRTRWAKIRGEKAKSSRK